MIFRSVDLKNYRNFSHVNLQFSPRVNFFIGDNGQGKTNLLEGLYYLTQGKSFRFSKDETLVRQGHEHMQLTASVERRDLDYRLAAVVNDEEKKFLTNGKKTSTFDLRKKFPVVLFSPESLSIIKESSELRRTLIDDFLITIDETMAHLQHDFRKALKTRNRVLKTLQEATGTERRQQQDILESLNQTYLKLAVNLTWYRLRAIHEIQPDLNAAMQSIQHRSDVHISVEMVVSDQKAGDWSKKEVHDAIYQRALELRDSEIASGTSLVGPHKHDIRFLYNQNDSRFFCSQGQQRSLILAFKMAQIVYHRKVHGFYPVLMLDDVLSELDSEKRNALIGFLHEINTQVFLTSTDLTLPSQFSMEDSFVFRVENGTFFRETEEMIQLT